MGEVQTYWNPLRNSKHLQTGAVDDLVVDDELTATVVDDKGTDGATAIGEGLGDALVEATLGDNLETLLDITGLGHGDETVVITDVQDAVGLEDGAEHGLHNDGGRGVGDETGLLLQLAGEQVDTEVTVLAGLGGDRDTDHLARATLKDQDVANANEVAGDGDGLAGGAAVARLNNADVGSRSGLFVVISTSVGVRVGVGVGEGVGDAVDSAANATAERVVFTFVVVVTHLARRGGVTDGRLGNSDLRRGVTSTSGLDLTKVRVVFSVRVDGSFGSPVVRDFGRLRLVTVGRVYGLTITTVVRDVEVVGRGSLVTVVSFSDVDLILDNLIVDLSVFLVGRGLRLAGVAKGKDVSPGSTGTINI